MYVENMEIVKVGPLRLFKAIMDRIQLTETINAGVRWDETQWKISPGDLIAALVMAMFCGRRALFSLNRVFARGDLELLFGRRDLTAEDFNDDCLGRALDRLSEANFNEIFGGIALRAQGAYGFAVDGLHADTTSISVYGDYAAQDAEAPLVLARGFNKDHRFDLKQFKYGLATNADGIPLFGEAVDGNLDDKTWSRMFLDYAPELRKFMTERTVIVVDAAAMSAKSLEIVKEKGLRLISRLPETFSLCEELKRKAHAKGAWQPAMYSDDEKKNARYKLQAFSAELVNGTYTFVVVQSQSLEKTKVKAVEAAVAKEAKRVEKALAELAKNRFARLEEAEAAWKEWAAGLQPRYHELNCTLRRVEEVLKRPRPGRPAKNANPGTRMVYVVEGAFSRDEARIEEAKRLACTFVLFCSAPELTPSQILGHYKDRVYIENRFRFLKDPYFVGPVNLKLPQRVQALGHVMLLALLVYSLFEWSVRQGLKRENEPFHVAGSYKTFRPRGETVLHDLDDVVICRIDMPNGVIRQLPRNYSRRAERIVRLCGFDMSIYVKPPMASKA